MGQTPRKFLPILRSQMGRWQPAGLTEGSTLSAAQEVGIITQSHEDTKEALAATKKSLENNIKIVEFSMREKSFSTAHNTSAPRFFPSVSA
jgi:nicotinic acid phosphoribosyltransferase